MSLKTVGRPQYRISADHRWVMSRAGVLEPNGARVLSYLLFERRYCRHLMHLGYMDAVKQRERILDFLGYESALRRPCGGRHSRERFTACASVFRVTAAGP
jgi:hypothetical protein